VGRVEETSRHCPCIAPGINRPEPSCVVALTDEWVMSRVNNQRRLRVRSRQTISNTPGERQEHGTRRPSCLACVALPVAFGPRCGGFPPPILHRQGRPRRMNDRTSGATALPPIRMLRLSLPLRRSTYLTPAVTLFRSLFYHPEHHPPASPQRPNRDNPQRRQRSCIQIKHPRIISVTTRRKPHDTITSRRSSLGRAVHVPHGPRSCSVGDRSSDKGQGEDRTGTSYSLLHAQNLTTRLGSRDA
jgi:hypothetical protein